MIIFFRKIRQQLLTENKFSKYLLYAIGEVVLVVIGILIALQLNTWRMEKKDRQIEKTLLKNLKKDLGNDIQGFRRVKKFNISQNETCIRLLDYIIDESKPLEDTIQFVNDFHLIVFFSIPYSNKTSYNLAVNTGYLNNILSDNLVNELSNYYNNNFLDNHVTDTERFINIYNENNLMQKYPMFSKSVMVNEGDGGKYAMERYRNDNRPILQLHDIRGDISLENYLNGLSMRLKIGVKALENSEKRAQGLILRIENQLIKIDN